jgi:hypothetical protein
MKTIVGILAAVAASLPLGAADPPEFAIWKAANLRSRDAALSTHVADDHSSRETLAEYGDHRFRMLYRDADGNPEQHDAIIDVVLVQSGEGTLQLGGAMAGKRTTSAGEWVGRGSTAATVIPSAPATSSTFPRVCRTRSSSLRASTSRTCC